MTSSPQSFLPKINPNELCEAIGLCTVRMHDNKPYCGVKLLDGKQYELPLEQVANADEFEGKKIARSYSSGCVFIDKNRVYLLTTEKNNKQQHQFTGGSPLEENLQDVYVIDNGIVKLNIEKIYDNALLRTYKRTGVEVIETYNDMPLIDWALIENTDKEGNVLRRLVLLMHFVVKKYLGVLNHTSEEQVVDGNWYDIKTLEQQKNLAPNAIIIANHALQLIANYS